MTAALAVYLEKEESKKCKAEEAETTEKKTLEEKWFTSEKRSPSFPPSLLPITSTAGRLRQVFALFLSFFALPSGGEAFARRDFQTYKRNKYTKKNCDIYVVTCFYYKLTAEFVTLVSLKSAVGCFSPASIEVYTSNCCARYCCFGLKAFP